MITYGGVGGIAERRRKHSEDFKRNVVALSCHSEKSMAEITRDPGIHRSGLVRWCKEGEELVLLGERAFPGNGLHRLSPLEEENLRLKKQLADVTGERDILKSKCTSFRKNRSNLPVYRQTHSKP
ncbi:MAG: transposase [Bacillota bacterium]|nr:transposase [Bacillota bacterium]